MIAGEKIERGDAVRIGDDGKVYKVGTVERGGQFTTDDEALINLFTQAQKEEQRLSDAFLKDTLGAHFDLPVEGRSYRVVSQEGYLRRGAQITFRIEEAK